jgi:hypothetical protein
VYFWLAAITAGALPAFAIDLSPGALRAFDAYVGATEKRLDEQLKSGRFLWVDQSPERLKRVRAGEVVIEPQVGKGDMDVDGGLVHDWAGSAFIPGVSLAEAIAYVQDYNHHQSPRQPELLASKLISRNGDEFRVYMRLFKKKVISVTLDTEHDVRYFPIDAKRWRSRSYSTKIAEIENAGTRNERELPPGKDHGFLWRLYSYWRFQERDGGVYIECEAVSLTRGVPTGLGWLIEPIIRGLPRESLSNTLQTTREAIAEESRRPAR